MPSCTPPRLAGQDQLLRVGRAARCRSRRAVAARRTPTRRRPGCRRAGGTCRPPTRTRRASCRRPRRRRSRRARGRRSVVAKASPKLATSTPSSLSLVDMSAPVKVPGPVEQGVDDDLGHRVARGDQAVHLAARGGALADREDRAGRRCGTARRRGRRRARRRRGRTRGRARRAAGCRRRTPRPGRRSWSSRRPPRCRPGAPAARPRASSPVMASVSTPAWTRDAELLDVADQGGAAGAVELHRHQPRRHLDDVGLQAELDAARWPPRARAARRR